VRDDGRRIYRPRLFQILFMPASPVSASSGFGATVIFQFASHSLRRSQRSGTGTSTFWSLLGEKRTSDQAGATSHFDPFETLVPPHRSVTNHRSHDALS